MLVLPHSKLGIPTGSEPGSLLELLMQQDKTDLKSSSTACGKVWKLLFRLIWVPSTKAIFPNICKSQCEVSRVPSFLRHRPPSRAPLVPELPFLLFIWLWASPKEIEIGVWVLWGLEATWTFLPVLKTPLTTSALHLGQEDKVC